MPLKNPDGPPPNLSDVSEGMELQYEHPLTGDVTDVRIVKVDRGGDGLTIHHQTL